jgi:hypothetical protein
LDPWRESDASKRSEGPKQTTSAGSGPNPKKSSLTSALKITKLHQDKQNSLEKLKGTDLHQAILFKPDADEQNSKSFEFCVYLSSNKSGQLEILI